jgi:hypothetical protein
MIDSEIAAMVMAVDIEVIEGTEHEDMAVFVIMTETAHADVEGLLTALLTA